MKFLIGNSAAAGGKENETPLYICWPNNNPPIECTTEVHPRPAHDCKELGADPCNLDRPCYVFWL